MLLLIPTLPYSFVPCPAHSNSSLFPPSVFNNVDNNIQAHFLPLNTTFKPISTIMDAMNVDWCLTCNKQTSHGRPYCSKLCKLRGIEAGTGEFSYISDDASSSSDALRDSPSYHQHHPRDSSRRHTHMSSSSHRRRVHRSPRRAHTPQQQFLDAELAALSQWPGYGNDAGIRAWASAIPAGCATAEPASISLGPSHTCARPEFPLSRQRPARPALCTDTTQPARTNLRSSSPISLPSPRGAEKQLDYSMSSYSLVSALTESIVAPDSVRPRTKTQVHAGDGDANASGRPSVLEGLARRLRTWGASTPARSLKHDTPAEIFMQTTTTTFTASPSASSPPSPIQRSNTTNSKGSSGFTVRGVDAQATEDDQEHEQNGTIFVKLPIKGARSPLTLGDAELKQSLACDVLGSGAEPLKRGVWIAGREKAVNGWAGYGPAYYEKNYRERGRTTVHDMSEREFKEFEAWRARGRKTVRR